MCDFIYWRNNPNCVSVVPKYFICIKYFRYALQPRCRLSSFTPQQPMDHRPPHRHCLLADTNIDTLTKFRGQRTACGDTRGVCIFSSPPWRHLPTSSRPPRPSLPGRTYLVSLFALKFNFCRLKLQPNIHRLHIVTTFTKIWDKSLKTPSNQNLHNSTSSSALLGTTFFAIGFVLFAFFVHLYAHVVPGVSNYCLNLHFALHFVQFLSCSLILFFLDKSSLLPPTTHQPSPIQLPSSRIRKKVTLAIVSRGSFPFSVCTNLGDTMIVSHPKLFIDHHKYHIARPKHSQQIFLCFPR